MKKLFLSPFFAGDELDVIENQDVYIPKFRFKLIHLVSSK